VLDEVIFTASSAPFQADRAELSRRGDGRRAHREESMSTIVKVLEVIAESEKSFEDAAQQAVREAAKSVRDIKSIWIENFSGVVKGDRIVEYRVNAKISFVVEGHK
jgi:flavin-binding protein dodecin